MLAHERLTRCCRVKGAIECSPWGSSLVSDNREAQALHSRMHVACALKSLIARRAVVQPFSFRLSDIRLKLHALNDHRDPLPHADTHRAQREAALRLFQLIQRSCCEACAARAERMTDRNRTAIRVHMRRIVRKP